MSSHYVVHCFTRVQDGHEEGAKIFSSLDEALAYINKHADCWGAINEFKLFELGKEIPLSQEVVKEVKKEVTEVTRYSLKKGKR